MLVIISDLHLSDGSFGTTLAPGAFQMFAGRLADLARRASWRADGSFRPIDRVDLVLLGDILDITKSAHWIESNVRPWHDANEPLVADKVAEITDHILKRNSTSLRMMRALASEGAIRIPLSNQPGVAAGAQSIPVPVRIHYMVGNHDWQLHLPGVAYDMIRQRVAHHLGLANPHTEPFAHDPLESEELLETLRRHRVICRHGDEFDPLSYSEDRDVASLNDAIVIELMIRFERTLKEEFGDELPKIVQHGLSEMDKIRPSLLIPVWIEGLMERANTPASLRRSIKAIWDELVDEFLAMTIVRERDSWSPIDMIDGLQLALKFSKRHSVGWASRILEWVGKVRGGNGDSFLARARSEQDFRNRRARHIVYGHTHQFETIPLDASFADTFTLNQLYFNTGTWQRVYRSTLASPQDHEFIPVDSLSYLSFFQSDERSGRPFETWNGNLGINPAELRSFDGDIDLNQAQASSAIGNASSSLSHPPISRPHFAPVNAPHSSSVPRSH